MQWFKRFSDATPCLDAYDPTEARRRLGQGRGAGTAAAPRAPLFSAATAAAAEEESRSRLVEAERDLYVTKLRDVERRVQTRPAVARRSWRVAIPADPVR